MKTILKTATIALILCVMMMSGCIGSSGTPDIPITLYVDVGGENVPGSFTARIIMEEDGTAEFCSIVNGKEGVFSHGTWAEGSSDREYEVTSVMSNVIYVTILDDGVAEMTTLGVSQRGTWKKGAIRR